MVEYFKNFLREFFKKFGRVFFSRVSQCRVSSCNGTLQCHSTDRTTPYKGLEKGLYKAYREMGDISGIG